MAPTPPLSPRERWITALTGLVTLVLFLLPAGLGPRVIVGDPLGETDNHLWMFWRALSRLPEPVANLPDGVPIPLMDPFNLPFYAVGGWLDPVLGWWSLRIFNEALALWGGLVLCRLFAGERGARVGMVALGSAPLLAGLFDFGITEGWPLGLFALHLAALVQHGRQGRAWTAVAAGLSLGLIGLCGWYFALFGLLTDALVVPALLWRHRRPGLLLQGLLALAMVLPRFLAFRAVQGQWAHRWYPPAANPPGYREGWMDITVRGTDLFKMILPHPEVLHPGKSSYLGLVLLALVGLGLLRRRRQVGALLLAAAPFLVLAMGYWPTVAGHTVGIPGPPFYLVKLVPSLLGLSHWERAMAGALPFLAVAAAVAVEAWPRLARGWWLVAALVLADGLAFSGASWPRGVYRVDLPAGLETLPGQDGLIQLPFDNNREPFSTDPARTYNRWQVALNRPVSENYEGPDAVLFRSRLIAAAQARCRLRDTLPPYYQPPPDMRNPPPPSGAALDGELRLLRGWGYGWVVLHRGRCPAAAPTIQLLDAALGPGRELAGGDWAWPLPALAAPDAKRPPDGGP